MEHEEIKISAIVPVFNGEKYIRDTLDSLLEQTLSGLEIICVNDCSTDCTGEILRDYTDKIIVLNNKHNIGAGASRNRGLEEAHGVYVIFLDCDDIFLPDMLKKAYEKAIIADSDVCVFKENLIDTNGRIISYPYSENKLKKLGELDYFSPEDIKNVIFQLWEGWPWDKLFRRGHIEKQGLKFQDLHNTNDGFFVNAAILTCKKICFINEKLIVHRIGLGGSISNSREQYYQDCFTYLNGLIEFMKERQIYSIYEHSLISFIGKFTYWYGSTLTINKDNFWDALKKLLDRQLDISKYDKDYFYNSFDYYFLTNIKNGMIDNLPKDLDDYYRIICVTNKQKIMEMFNKLENMNLYVWGAGVRTRLFLAEYGYLNKIQGIFETNPDIRLKKEVSAVEIIEFNAEVDSEKSCIFILNDVFLDEIDKQLKNRKAHLFDFDSYLRMPGTVKEFFV